MFNPYGKLAKSIGEFCLNSKEILFPLLIIWTDYNMLRNHSLLPLQIPVCRRLL